MIRKLLLVLLIVSNSYLIAKTLVLLNSKKEAIINTEIFVFGNEVESIKTDNNGKITLKQEWIKDNKIKILILNDNYEAIEQEVEIIEEETIFSPKEKPKGVRRLQNVVVRTKSKVRGDLKISSEEIKKYIQSGYFNDVGSVIKDLPGVSSNGDGTAELFIQGGSNNEWIALYDHMWILNTTRFGEYITAFNPLLVESVEFYTAGYPVSIGQGLAGVLWIETLRPSQEDWKFYLAVDKGTEFMAHGPISKNASMLINFRRSWIDFLGDLVFTNFEKEESIFPVITDGLIKLYFDLTENDKLQFIINTSYEVIKFRNKIEKEEEKKAFQYDAKTENLSQYLNANDTNILTSLKYIRYFGDNNILTTTISSTPRFAEFTYNISSDIMQRNKIESFPYQMTIDFATQAFENHQITVGINYYNYQAKTEGKTVTSYFNEAEKWVKKEDNITDEYTRFILGSYVMDDWNISEKLVLQTGLRLDYYQQRNQVAIQPRGGITYNLTDQLSTFTRGGYYTSNNPNIITPRNLTSPKDVGMEKAIHSISGIEYNYNRLVYFNRKFL